MDCASVQGSCTAGIKEYTQGLEEEIHSENYLIMQ